MRSVCIVPRQNKKGKKKKTKTGKKIKRASRRQQQLGKNLGQRHVNFIPLNIPPIHLSNCVDFSVKPSNENKERKTLLICWWGKCKIKVTLEKTNIQGKNVVRWWCTGTFSFTKRKKGNVAVVFKYCNISRNITIGDPFFPLFNPPKIEKCKRGKLVPLFLIMNFKRKEMGEREQKRKETKRGLVASCAVVAIDDSIIMAF